MSDVCIECTVCEDRGSEQYGVNKGQSPCGFCGGGAGSCIEVSQESVSDWMDMMDKYMETGEKGE